MDVECPIKDYKGKIERTNFELEILKPKIFQTCKKHKRKLEDILLYTDRTTITADNVHICRLQIGTSINHG